MFKRGKNRFIFLKLGIVIAIFALAAIIAGCASSPARPEEQTAPNNIPGGGLAQSNTGGAVTIEVKWLPERNDSLVFDVSMNTHSANLDGYDLKQMAVLRDGQGNEYYPTSWNSAPGGHHRSGRLTFVRPDSFGMGQVKSFELIIRDVASVKERVFKWLIV